MRKIEVNLVAGGPSRIVVDGIDLSSMISAVRILGAAGEIPAVQLEIRGDIAVTIPEGLAELMPDGDPSGLLAGALSELDPAGLEKAILAHLGGLGGGTTGEAAKTALLEWAQGYGRA